MPAAMTGPTTEDRPTAEDRPAPGAAPDPNATPDPNAAPDGLVTFLFSDIQGSTRLWEEHPEPMRHALARHDALVRAAIGASGGQVFKTVGDAFHAAFDRPEDALAAALAIQRALHAEPWGLPEGQSLRVRLALHAGTAERRGGDYFGAALSRAARLLGAAWGGQTVVSEATAGLLGADGLPEGAFLRSLGRHRLKDLTQPQEIFHLAHPDLPDDFPPPRSLESFQHNLPGQLTSFVGREHEMGQARAGLTTSRLVTLTGTGGAGKSRLAVQVAADALDDFPDGAWLVELAPLSDPALVPQAVAGVLGLGEEAGRGLSQTLTDALRPKALLLVLDNCEHLVDACARLAESLLRSCPKLRILATSREALDIPGERTLPVSSLSLSAASLAATPASLAASGAVRLFVERAASARPGFRLDETNAGAIARICADLDGLPLALELAAARVKVLSPEQIAGRLDDRFRLLSGGSRTALPRQQTLRALIDWSYDLLPPPEQTLLRRLSVFSGGWSLDAAETVCAGGDVEDWEVLDLLSHLVAKSLVIVEPPEDGQVRYRMLQNLRRYGSERLAEAGEADALRGHHLAWHLAFAEDAAPRLTGPDQADWLNRLARDHDNLRAALDTARDAPDGAESELRLAGALWRFWHVRGYLSEGRQRFASALARADDAPPAVRAQALGGAGILAWSQQDYREAESRCEASLALWLGMDNKLKAAAALNTLALVAEYQGDYGQARTRYEMSLEIFEEANDAGRAAVLMGNIGALAMMEGDVGKAAELFERGLILHRSLGDDFGVANALHNLGEIAYKQERYDSAYSFFSESLAGNLKLGHESGMLSTLASTASVLVKRRELPKAARLLSTLEALIASKDKSVLAMDRQEYEQNLAFVRAEINEQIFAAAWQRGQAMTLEEAVQFALSPAS